MSKKNHGEPPSDGVDQANQTPRRPSLSDAVSRGYQRGMKAGLWRPGRNHIFARAGKRHVVEPLMDLTGLVQDAFKGLSGKRRAEPGEGQELFEDVAPHYLQRWIRIAQTAYAYHLGVYLVGAICMSIAATNGGLTGVTMLVGGIGMMIYALVNALRISRDVHMMRTRRYLSLGRFLGRLEDLWFPLAPDHWAYAIARFVLVPAMAFATVAAPIVALIY